jgi:hypothetical protein
MPAGWKRKCRLCWTFTDGHQGATVRKPLSARSIRQLIRDQTLRMIAHCMDARRPPSVYMPPHLRDGYEAYGQVESHVRQVVNSTVGWFGNGVRHQPLSLRESGPHVDMMGGGAPCGRRLPTRSNKAGSQTGGLGSPRYCCGSSRRLRGAKARSAARASDAHEICERADFT